MIDDELLLHLAITPLAPEHDSFTVRDERALHAFISEYSHWYTRLQVLLSNTDMGMKQWSVQYKQDCSRFCTNMKLSNRIKHHLLKMADLTRNSILGNSPGPLRASGFEDHEFPYPNFIETIDRVVTGEAVIPQLGIISLQQLSGALVRYYKGEGPKHG